MSRPISRAPRQRFQVGCSESVLDPGGKQYAFDRRIVRQFWSGSEHRTLGRLSNQAFFAEALPIFMECCLGFFMVGDRLLRLPHFESFSLSSPIHSARDE